MDFHSKEISPMKLLLSTILFTLSLLAIAADMPYDESADASTAIKQALIDAGSTNKSVLLVFGANWCEDCRALDRAIKTEKNADLIAKASDQNWHPRGSYRICRQSYSVRYQSGRIGQRAAHE
jgi:thiol-disulfide isomerase/thioredoxin